MNLGKAISKIRKDKNIPVSYLIQGYMSRSTYNYFIECKTDISANKLDIIIKRLNLTWNEIEFICNNYINKFNNVNQQIQSALSEQNTSKLIHIKKGIYKSLKSNKYSKYDKYYHLYCSLNLLIERMKNKPQNKKYIYPIKYYLLHRYIWTNYELSLFNDSLFAFNHKTINIFINRALKDSKKYHSFYKNNHEYMILLTNAIYFYLIRKQLKKAQELLTQLNQFKPKNNQILLRLSIKYLNNIRRIIIGNKKEKKQGKIIIKEIISYLKFVKSNYYFSYKKSFHKIINIYRIE